MRANRGRRYIARGVSALAPLNLFSASFHRLLDRIDHALIAGGIHAMLPDGRQRTLGLRADGPVATVTLHSWRALLSLGVSGSVGWYEAWARGDWSSPDPVPLFELFVLNRATLGNAARSGGISRMWKRLVHRLRANSRTGSRRNIAYHYDLGNDFYAPWLDAGMTYSSAIFTGDGETLEDAQRAKLDAILARAGARAGDTILEIGCGWGSFAETAARRGVHVHGITLSSEQMAYAGQRIAAAGLPNARFSLTDYRDVTGQYDAVASIEMVEAVGRQYWSDYLATIARVLKPGGRAAIQLISIAGDTFDTYADNVDFIQAYIFPGGLLIGEREFRAIAERHGLEWHDRTGFGASYAETLKRWRERFDTAAAQGRLPVEFDQHFIDLWRYYLMYCEGGFRGGGIDVAQVTLIKH